MFLWLRCCFCCSFWKYIILCYLVLLWLKRFLCFSVFCEWWQWQCCVWLFSFFSVLLCYCIRLLNLCVVLCFVSAETITTSLCLLVSYTICGSRRPKTASECPASRQRSNAESTRWPVETAVRATSARRTTVTEPREYLPTGSSSTSTPWFSEDAALTRDRDRSLPPPRLPAGMSRGIRVTGQWSSVPPPPRQLPDPAPDHPPGSPLCPTILSWRSLTKVILFLVFVDDLSSLSSPTPWPCRCFALDHLFRAQNEEWRILRSNIFVIFWVLVPQTPHIFAKLTSDPHACYV